MTTTYLSLHYHVVFSTKNRAPLISQDWQSDFHEYLGGTINGLGGFSQGVGGVADHVHLLFGLRATHCLADFIREVKKASSNWTKEMHCLEEFHWQDGYSAFTVRPTLRSKVQNYIKRQANHHRRRTFREELIELLRLAEIEYDERYLD